LKTHPHIPIEVVVASVESGASTVAASWGVEVATDTLIPNLFDGELDLRVVAGMKGMKTAVVLRGSAVM
jgi:hypothetical protein